MGLISIPVTLGLPFARARHYIHSAAWANNGVIAVGAQKYWQLQAGRHQVLFPHWCPASV